MTASSKAPVVTSGRERAVGASTTTTAASSSTSNNVTRVVVEGCGISEVNGTYNNRAGLQNVFFKYAKTGIWEGKLVTLRWAITKRTTPGVFLFGMAAEMR